MKEIKLTDVKAEKDQLSERQKASFAGPFTVLELSPEFSLWRFVHTKNGRRFSDCWIDGETMTDLMGIFRGWGDYRQQTKKKVVRDNLAVLTNWKGTELSWRLKIVLRKPIIAYKGRIGPQGHFMRDVKLSEEYKVDVERKVESRVGGFNQYVIPRFGGISSEAAADFAEIAHFAHI